ncbi:hypothetical protein K474DRAFT_1666113 [Panus rudis PR-1116 ss-1]|nr:hypothetical protein K474DRAFT_1666113 [Panus rudis PR-1116 ss-1]
MSSWTYSTSAAVAAASSTPAAKPASSSAAKFDYAGTVFNLDVVLLGILAVFVLFSLPRAIARFSHGPEWFAGLFLRSVDVEVPAQQLEKQPSIAYPRQAHTSPTTPGRHARPPFASSPVDEDQYENSTEESFSPVSGYGYDSRPGNLLRNKSSSSAHANLLRNTSTSSGRVRRTGKLDIPTHMSAWSTMLPSVASIPRYQVKPGLSLGKAILILAYFAAMLYAGLVRANPFTTPVPAGYVAISQIPVVVVLATKNNIPGMLLGMGYERLNVFHRYAGLILILAVNVHSLGFIYAWSIAGTFTQHMAVPHYRAGMVALGAADVLYFFSTSFWRNKFYEFFLITHIVGIIVLLGAICMHSNASIPYVLIALGLYALDRTLRFAKTRYAYAHLTPLPSLGMTKIEVPALNAGWRAGQHVRVRVLSLGGPMGWFGWTECHPFSIASVEKSVEGDGMVLYVKKVGKWTNRLYELAKRSQYSSSNAEAGEYQTGVKVLIEGPYGGPGHTLFPSFSGALLVAGGSGITFALSHLHTLIAQDLSGHSRLKVIDLVWVVQDPNALEDMLPVLKRAVRKGEKAYASVRVRVCYTRAGNGHVVQKMLMERGGLPEGIELSAGRPKFGSILSNVVDQACALSMFKRGARSKSLGGSGGLLGVGAERGPSGVVVGVCGPGGLAQEMGKVVDALDRDRRKAVGGVELCEEVFGW